MGKDLQEHKVFLIPKKGLMVRDPKTYKPLADAGEFKLLCGGSEGRYWRRRIKDGSVTLGKPTVAQKARRKTAGQTIRRRGIGESLNSEDGDIVKLNYV